MPGTTVLAGTVRCPRCREILDLRMPAIVCEACGRSYPRLGRIPVLLADPEAYLASCRRQLALLEQQCERTVSVIEEQLRRGGVLPATRARCGALIEAVRGQADDIRSILQPVVGNVSADAGRESVADELPGPLKYIHCLFRDWGWPPEPAGENEKALAAVEAVTGGRSLGRTLVLGAGACRLAYDLHRLDRESEMIAADIDAFLFTAAHTIIRGGSVAVREANVEVHETERAARTWMLQAPRGAIAEDRFAFVLADGREPPFAAGAFDTVLTPWFIDVVPADLRDLISSVYRILKPGGQWVNLGPLRYRQDVPVTRRFAREEVFDLAARAGFRVDRWQGESMPYLVSKLNGRGKVEWVLAFSATRMDAPARQDSDGEPPSWLLFTHVPIPVFAGQTLFWSDDPATQIVVSAIDGRNTLDDIAALLASQAGEAGLTMEQFREVVRRCLAEAHPDCRG